MADDEVFRPNDEPPEPEGVRIIDAAEAEARASTGRPVGDPGTPKGEGGEGPRRPEGDDASPAAADEPAGDEPGGDEPGSDQPEPVLRFPLAAEASSRLPHWSEPAPGGDDDFAAWSRVTQSQPRWRGPSVDFDEGDDLASLTGPTPTVPADPSPGGWEDFDDLDEGLDDAPPPRAEHRPTAGRHRVGGARTSPRTERSRTFEPDPGGRDVTTAVVTGVALAAGFLVAVAIGSAAVMAVVAAVIGLAAIELYDALRRGGYHPAGLVGLVACVSAPLAAYWRGPAAIGLVMALAVVWTFLWFILVGGEHRGVADIATTLLGVGWVGLLGAYGGLLLAAPDGVALLVGAVLATVAADVAALFVGRRSGRTQIAPAISPAKTSEGLLGGLGAAVVVSVLVLAWLPGIGPWDGEVAAAALLGVLAGIVGPVGDLSESLIKRDLGLKDMGSILPGHGGILDRFDGMLMMLPATWYLVRVLDLV